ncbi:hypothetical protein C8R42DRAFT_659412 [Lentinula raphanica]|nr:hypothetical protein C8R42DRAFT_659412 [Lentinula raphanica]
MSFQKQQKTLIWYCQLLNLTQSYPLMTLIISSTAIAPILLDLASLHVILNATAYANFEHVTAPAHYMHHNSVIG